jgi:PAS domain S-box-containing protein
MSFLISSYFTVIGICLAVGLIHLFVFLSAKERKTDLLFAATVFSMAAASYFEIRTYLTPSLDAYLQIFKAGITFQGVAWIAFTWFVYFFTGKTRRVLAWLTSALFGVAVLINILSPSGIIFSKVASLERIVSFFGIPISYPMGEPNPLRLLPDLAYVLMVYLVLESCLRLYRANQKRRALLFGASVIILLGGGYLHGTLVDLGVLPPPYLISFTFIFLVLFMSMVLAGEAAQSAALGRKVMASEHRWRMMLENVRLLVAGIDSEARINYANPYFSEVSGYSNDEVIGRPVLDFIPAENREQMKKVFSRALGGDLNPKGQAPFLTKDGRVRQMAWSRVLLRDGKGEVTGTLSIGEDMTEILRVEQALKEEKERMGVILGTLNTGLVLLDAELNVTWVNQMLQSFFPGQDLLGKKCYAVAESRTTPCEDCGAVMALGDGSVHETERFNAQIDRWMHIVSLPIKDEHGRVTQVLEATTDITERKETEAARDRYLAEIRTLTDRLERENIYLKEEIESDHGFSKIVGQSNALLYVLTKVQQVAKTDATVMIEGETGAGKELIARAIHDSSNRASGPFIRVDCTVIPSELVESELFGHEAGAFTGAAGQRKGRFELAQGGTVFLDEVSELPADTQAKLLRVLQEKEFERVGGSRTIQTDVRIIAATNRNLTEDVADGRFRADLFYRLNVYPVTVPPLLRRKEDIPLLVNHFVKRFCRKTGKHIDQVPPSVMEQFTAYDWPGNVRELRNVIERAVITTSGPVLRLPEPIGFPATARMQLSNGAGNGLRTLEEVERDHILRVLEATAWRISGPKGAAKILGLNPSTLRFRMKKLGIEKGR